MSEPRASTDSDAAAMPRWVKLLGIAALAAVLVVVILHLAGGGLGHHVPGRHPPEPHAPGPHGAEPHGSAQP